MTMRLRRYFADPREYRRVELAEIAGWLRAHPVTRCHSAFAVPAAVYWPRPVENERISSVALKVLARDEAIARFKPYQTWWRAPAA